MLSKSGLNYEITGSQSERKLVFLHGLMGSLNNWRSVAKQFSAAFEVLLVDQRGHGKSPHPPEGYSPEHYAQDLLDLIEELDWNQVHLVGHSMGGRNALIFAHHFSDRVSSLVVEDISVGLRTENVEKIEKMILDVPVPFLTRGDAKAYFEREFVESRQGAAKAIELALYLLSNISENRDQEGLSWRFSLKGVLESLDVGRTRDFWTEWQEIQVPILLVRGEFSSDLSASDYEAMLAKNTRARGEIIPRAGHWVHFDAQEDFVNALRTFYDSLTSSSRVV